MRKLKYWPKDGNGRASVCSRGCKRKPKRPVRFFPLRPRPTRKLTLRTVVGMISVVVDYGRDPQSGKWVCPARRRWDLGAHQKMTPALEDRVCLTATLADSYAAAAQLAAKWGSPVEVSTIRAHACQVGQRAAAQAQARRSLPESPRRLPAGVKASAPAALVIMMDGWLARQRGRDWGRHPARCQVSALCGTRSKEQ
jgi:hypothetical protein